MITPKNIKDLTKLIADGSSLKNALITLNINNIEFVKHLNKNQEDKNDFELATQIAVQAMLDDCRDLLDDVDDRLELDKAKLRIAHTQWLAEKIIPKTYGQRVDVNQNVTIDIRSVIALAEGRMKQANVLDISDGSDISEIEESVKTPRRLTVDDLIE